jgi:hypothetical protein
MVASTPTKLSNLQLHLLKMYSHDISDNDLNAVQKILAKYFLSQARDEMDILVKDKDWNVTEKVEEWSSAHLRKSTK